jgi:glycosyltransferase involved in cell wall biosynthesis
MKIVIVGTAFPLRGGIAHFNALLASHLKKKHTVTTVTFRRQYPRFLFPGKTQEEQGVPEGIEPAPQWIDSVNPLNWISVAKKIARLQPDLLIFKYWLPFFGPCFGTIAKQVKQQTGAKALFICDNIIPHERRPGDVAFTRYAFRQADFFIVQSYAVEKELHRYFPGSLYRNVPHPVYENFGEPLPKPEAKERIGISAARVILFFGYVRPYKGLMVLLEAMRELDDLVLLVVGEFYDPEEPYRKKITEWNLQSRVRVVSEYVPNDDVRLYFSASDVVVLPYVSATQSGIVQIAYHFNKPVIVTDVGGLTEVVKNDATGFIVPPEQPQALAESIRTFYAQNKEEIFTENVMREKKNYSWDALTSAIEELAVGTPSRTGT